MNKNKNYEVNTNEPTISNCENGSTQNITYTNIGEGECRQENGDIPIIFSKTYYQYDLPLTDDQKDKVTEDCQDLCSSHEWCLASQLQFQENWYPKCDLVTDYNTLPSGFVNSTEWGGEKIFDGVTYQTFCGGNGDCVNANNFGNGSIYQDDDYFCYTKQVEDTNECQSCDTGYELNNGNCDLNLTQVVSDLWKDANNHLYIDEGSNKFLKIRNSNGTDFSEHQNTEWSTINIEA